MGFLFIYFNIHATLFFFSLFFFPTPLVNVSHFLPASHKMLFLVPLYIKFKLSFHVLVVLSYRLCVCVFFFFSAGERTSVFRDEQQFS